MRKVLLASLASVALFAGGLSSYTLGFGSTAWATPEVAPHLVVREVQWRFHRAVFSTTAPLQTMDETGVVYDDSAVVNNTGAGITAIADTTAPISMLTCSPWIGAAAPSDTAFAGKLVITDSGSGTGTYDSLYVVAQVSSDGRQWAWAATAVNTVPSATVWDNTVVVPLIKHNNCSQWSCRFPATVSGRTQPDVLSLNQWPLIRFIIYPDVSRSTTGITSLRCQWVYMSSDANVTGIFH